MNVSTAIVKLHGDVDYRGSWFIQVKPAPYKVLTQTQTYPKYDFYFTFLDGFHSFVFKIVNGLNINSFL